MLSDETEDPMVRHEAAEALAALSSAPSAPLLRQYLHDPHAAVRETCEIALAKIEWDASDEGRQFEEGLREKEERCARFGSAP